MNNGGRFSDGFILGLMVGGAAVFLLGTDSGKKLFKVLTQEGSEALSSVLEGLEEYEHEYMASKAEEKVKKEPLTIVEAESLDFKEASSDDQVLEQKKEVKHASSTEKPVRRFFKKSSK